MVHKRTLFPIALLYLHVESYVHVTYKANIWHQIRWRKTQSNPSKIRKKIRLSIHSLHIFNIVFEVLDRARGQQKEINEIQIGKEKAKVWLFVDDMLVQVTPKILPANSYSWETPSAKWLDTTLLWICSNAIRVNSALEITQELACLPPVGFEWEIKLVTANSGTGRQRQDF